MRKNDLAKLVVKLEAQTKQFQDKLEKAEGKVKKFAKQTDVSGKKIAGVLAGLASVVSVGAITSIYKIHAEGIDRLAKKADSLDIPISQLQGLRHAASLAGVETAKLDGAMSKALKNISDAADGKGEALDAFKKLEIDAKALLRLPISQQVGIIADKFNDLESAADKNNVAMRVFGRAGAGLVPLLNSGSQSIAAAIKEFDDLGASITRIDAAKIEIANDNMNRMGVIMQSIGQQFTITTAPIIAAIGEQFIGAAKDAGGFAEIGQKSSSVITRSLGFVLDMANGVKFAFLGVRLAVAEMANGIIQLNSTIVGFGGKIAEKLGFDVTAIKQMQNFSDSMSQTVKGFRDELQAAALAPPPSEKFKELVQKIHTDIESQAKQVALESGSALAPILNPDVSLDPASQTQKKVEAKREELSAMQRLERSYYAKLEQDMVAHHFKIKQFQKASTQSKIKTLITEGVAMTQGAANTSKKLFKINKALALADAAVSLRSAVLKSVERGGGWPWGAAFGALTLANGLAQIRAIKNARFGGGVSASIAGTTGGATPTVNVGQNDVEQISNQDDSAEDRGQYNITFTGNVYGNKEFKDVLLTTLADATDNNNIRITDQSGRLGIEVT